MPLTPEQKRDKWLSSLKGSTGAMTSSVDALTVSPMQQAIAQKAALIANWNQAVDTDNKWEQGLNAFGGLAEWKERFAVGIQKINSLTADQVPKVLAHFSKLDAIYANFDAIVTEVLDPVTGYTAPEGFTTIVINFVVNTEINRALGLITENSTPAQIKALIGPELVTRYSFVAN